MARIQIEFHIEDIPEDFETDLSRLVRDTADYQNENLILTRDNYGQDDIIHIEVYPADINDYANTRRVLMSAMAHIVGELI